MSTSLENFNSFINHNKIYDLEIKVGADEDIKIFKAHSTILKAKSPYFTAALSNNWVKKSEDGIILFEKKNICPKIFNVLLIYIYNTIINLNDLNPYEISELIDACDELCFNELIEDLQKHLIINKKEWIRHNLNLLHNSLSKFQSCSLVYNHFKELIDYSPELLIKSTDFKDIGKSMLIPLLKRNDLELDEIDIWSNVIRWGVGQIKNLEEKKPILEWSLDDFVELKNILCDIIPLIRFDEISSTDFYHEILPFQRIFDEGMYKELLEFYLNDKWQSRLLVQKGPRKADGNLLNSQMKHLVSNWIDGDDDLPYKFRLIFQGTRERFSKFTFLEKCHDIKQTVVVMKIKETGELVGGYNPLCWNEKGKSPNECYWIETNKSFLFKIDECQIKKSILSRVKFPSHAIYHNDNVNVNIHNMAFYEISVNFYDFLVYNNIKNEPYFYYCFNKSFPVYENDLNLVSEVNLLEEFEVYKLVK